MITGRRDSRGSNCCGLLCLFLSTLFMNTADVAASTTLGNEVATISDGGMFSRTGTSFRRFYCDRYHAMIGNGTDDLVLSNALSGREVSVFLRPNAYFRYDAATGIDPTYPGIHARILDHIAERGNFTWRQSFGVQGTGDQSNRSITEMLDWSTAKYDASVGAYTPSTARMDRGVAFVEGHFDGSLIMVRNAASTASKINWMNFATPFEDPLWVALIGVILFSSFAYHVIETIGGKGVAYYQGQSRRVWFMENIYLSFLNFTGNYSFVPLTLGGRIFGICFAFWAMLVTAAYTANLASLLVSQDVSDLKLADVEDAIKQQLSVCVEGGAFVEKFLRDNYPGIVPYVVTRQGTKLFDSLNRGDCDIVIAYQQNFDESLKQRSLNPKCTLTRQGRTVKHLRDGFTTRIDPAVLCTDLVKSVLSYHMKDMKDNEFLDEYWREHNAYYADDGHCDASMDGADADAALSSESSSGGAEKAEGALSLKDMAGTILFQIIGSAVALVVSIAAGFERKTKKKREIHRCATVETATPVAYGLESSSRDVSSVQGGAQRVAEKMSAHVALVQHMQDRLSNGGGGSGTQLWELNQQMDHLAFITEQMRGRLGIMPAA